MYEYVLYSVHTMYCMYNMNLGFIIQFIMYFGIYNIQYYVYVSVL